MKYWNRIPIPACNNECNSIYYFFQQDAEFIDNMNPVTGYIRITFKITVYISFNGWSKPVNNLLLSKTMMDETSRPTAILLLQQSSVVAILIAQRSIIWTSN